MTEKPKDPLKQDFRLFLIYIWKFLGLPKPTKIQLAIAWYLQHGPKRRMVQAFRGVGKSWITGAFALWRLYCDPKNEKILVVSANENKAIEFCTFVKRLIVTCPILQHLTPDRDCRDSVLSFDVAGASISQSPSVRAVGITGQMTGGRATLIISDDVEVPKNSATVIQRDKLSEAVKEYDAVLVPNGEIVYLGTPQTEESIYANLPDRGYDVRIWPIRYVSTDDNEKRYGGRICPSLMKVVQESPDMIGRSTEPTRFNDQDIMEREASYGKGGFLLQFMLDTSLSDAEKYPLKLSDLIVLDVDPQIAPVQVVWASGRQNVVELPNVGFNGDRFHSPMYVSDEFLPYEEGVMFIDPSGRGKDETSYVVLKSLKGMLYVCDLGGFTGGYDKKTLCELAAVAKKYQVNTVHVESNYGDGMFLSLLAPVMHEIYPVRLEEYRVSGQKERRIIDKLEPVLNQHRLVVPPRLIKKDYQDGTVTDYARHYRLFYQLTHITSERGSLVHDDRVEVLAEAVGYFTNKIKVSTELAEAKHKAKLEEQMRFDFIKRFKKNRGRGKRLKYA